MRPVPTNLDLSALIGQEITQLRIGAWQLQILFESEQKISCEGTVIVDAGECSRPVLTKNGWGDFSALRGLVGSKVETWKVEGSHEFSITLGGGTKIHFRSTTGPHEDFVIHPQMIII